jgi:hypothetical protein
MHENREISSTPWSEDQGRSAKAINQTADTHVLEKSDCAVLPVNQPNKEGQSSAEVGEGRAQTKENIVQSHILQTPHRFRSKRPLWNYGGLAIEMHSSADHRSVDGQLQRSRKNVLVRGLNRNCNHDLKNLFKGATTVASSKPSPPSGVLHGFSCQGYAARDGAPDLGQKDCQHCVDCVEERSKLRRPISETTNSLSVLDRIRSIPGEFL